MAAPLIVPSLLPANYSRLGETCKQLEEAGADRLQFDVMDGKFVPNLTVGADVAAAAREWVTIPFEAHLMVDDPQPWLLEAFANAGTNLIIVHAEACPHLHRTLGVIREAGAQAAVALNPATPPEAVASVLDLVHLVLVMTVNPGFGGQSYISTMEPKIRAVRELVSEADHDIDVEVDGGIKVGTAPRAVAAGANVLIAGSALFDHPAGFEAAIAELRSAATGGTTTA